MIRLLTAKSILMVMSLVYWLGCEGVEMAWLCGRSSSTRVSQRPPTRMRRGMAATTTPTAIFLSSKLTSSRYIDHSAKYEENLQRFRKGSLIQCGGRKAGLTFPPAGDSEDLYPPIWCCAQERVITRLVCL